MELSFDERGYLIPYGKNRIDHDQLEREFVSRFESESIRNKLYEGLIRYNDDLRSILGDCHYVHLLEQIEAVNAMIGIHEDDDFMRSQYQYRKEQFVKELIALLGEYQIKREDLAA
jgi:hypothetical protein